MPMTFNQLLLRAIKRSGGPVRMGISRLIKRSQADADFTYRGSRISLSLEVCSEVPQEGKYPCPAGPQVTVYHTPSRMVGEQLPLSKVTRLLPDLDLGDPAFQSLVSFMEEDTSWSAGEATKALEQHSKALQLAYVQIFGGTHECT